MKLLRTPEERFENLPNFPFKPNYVEVDGIRIHYVDEGMDTGPIIAQEVVRIDKDDTYESLQKKIQKVEHQLYPETLSMLVAKEKSKTGV